MIFLNLFFKKIKKLFLKHIVNKNSKMIKDEKEYCNINVRFADYDLSV